MFSSKLLLKAFVSDELIIRNWLIIDDFHWWFFSWDFRAPRPGFLENLNIGLYGADTFCREWTIALRAGRATVVRLEDSSMDYISAYSLFLSNSFPYFQTLLQWVQKIKNWKYIILRWYNFFFLFMNTFHFFYIHEGHSQIIDTPPPSSTKMTNLSINLRFNHSKVVTAGVESLFRPFEPKPEERKKVNFWKEPQRHPYTIINFPSSQNCHSLCAFSQFREEGE